MLASTHMIVRVREGDKLPGPIVKLLDTEKVCTGSGANYETIYTVVVLVDDE